MEEKSVNENERKHMERAARGAPLKDSDAFFVLDFIMGHRPWPGRSPSPANQEEVKEGKVFAALGYLSVLFLVPLLAAEDNRFARFHGKQGMALFAAGFVALEAAVISFGVWGLLPTNGTVVGALSGSVILAAAVGGWLGLSLIGVVKALRGRYWKVPVLGCLAEKMDI